MHIWEKRSIEEVMEHYDLNAAEVHAAILFYYDNKVELDAEYERNMKLLHEMGTSPQDFRAKIEARKQKS
jgi:hypothetical protein